MSLIVNLFLGSADEVFLSQYRYRFLRFFSQLAAFSQIVTDHGRQCRLARHFLPGSS